MPEEAPLRTTDRVTAAKVASGGARSETAGAGRVAGSVPAFFFGVHVENARPAPTWPRRAPTSGRDPSFSPTTDHEDPVPRPAGARLRPPPDPLPPRIRP